MKHGSVVLVLLICMTALFLFISPLFLRVYYARVIITSREKLYARQYAKEALLAYGHAYVEELQEQKKSIDRVFNIKNWPPKSRYQWDAQLSISGNHKKGYHVNIVSFILRG